jgi:hypothetical protein
VRSIATNHTQLAATATPTPVLTPTRTISTGTTSGNTTAPTRGVKATKALRPGRFLNGLWGQNHSDTAWLAGLLLSSGVNRSN